MMSSPLQPNCNLGHRVTGFPFTFPFLLFLVHVGGEHSGAIPMHSGVPQGSVMGPLLFLLFVNDLPDVLETMTLLFADDVKMVIRSSQSMNLHSSLTAAWDWSRSSPQIFFPRWVWHPHPCIYFSQGPRGSDGQYVLSLCSVH